MSLVQVKNRLGVTDKLQDRVISDLVQKSEEQLLLYINCGTTTYDEVPDSLEWLVTEMTVESYNRIGDEGVKSINSDGFSVTYDDDIFKRYTTLLTPFRNATGRNPDTSGFYFV